MTMQEDRRIELVKEVLEIVELRANDKERDCFGRTAYRSVADMLRYALDENEECLNQFNY